MTSVFEKFWEDFDFPSVSPESCWQGRVPLIGTRMLFAASSVAFIYFLSFLPAFGKICGSCSKALTGDQSIFMGQRYHTWDFHLLSAQFC